MSIFARVQKAEIVVRFDDSRPGRRSGIAVARGNPSCCNAASALQKNKHIECSFDDCRD